MALLRNMPQEVQDEYRRLSWAWITACEEGPKEAYDATLAARLAYEKAHGISFEAEFIVGHLACKGFTVTPQAEPWTVDEIQGLVREKLGEDLDPANTELFNDLLFLFNTPKVAAQ